MCKQPTRHAPQPAAQLRTWSRKVDTPATVDLRMRRECSVTRSRRIGEAFGGWTAHTCTSISPGASMRPSQSTTSSGRLPSQKSSRGSTTTPSLTQRSSPSWRAPSRRRRQLVNLTVRVRSRGPPRCVPAPAGAESAAGPRRKHGCMPRVGSADREDGSSRAHATWHLISCVPLRHEAAR